MFLYLRMIRGGVKALKHKQKYSHNTWNIADCHCSVISSALSLLILAAVRLLAGWRVVRHFDRRAAGFLTLSQLPQLFGQSRQVLEENKKTNGETSRWKRLWLHVRRWEGSLQTSHVLKVCLTCIHARNARIIYFGLLMDLYIMH